MSKIKVGSLVKLKSGSPIMTVINLTDNICTLGYFDIYQCYNVIDCIHVSALKKVKKDKK